LKRVLLIALICLFDISKIFCADVLDINQDKKIGIHEAINSLEVVSGIKSNNVFDLYQHIESLEDEIIKLQKQIDENFSYANDYIQKLLYAICKYHPSEPVCQYIQPDETYTNDFGMMFVYIRPGTFVMGSPENETCRASDEIQHTVSLTQGYYLQTTEVTQGQWKAVMGNNPSSFSNCGDDCPVEQISWEDAQKFIQKINLHEKFNWYHLPTEAQWEYACRAGSTTALANGVLVETECSYDTNLNEVGWYCGNANTKTYPVAQKKANAWGLFDMHGNVFEWCQDWYGDYPTNSVTDPLGPSVGSSRLLRGGSWSSEARFCRSSRRGSSNPNYRGSGVGLRLLRTIIPDLQ